MKQQIEKKRDYRKLARLRLTLNQDTNSDIYLHGGSILLHEKDHRDSGTDEVTAYTNQINFLDRMKQKKHFKKLK